MNRLQPAHLIGILAALIALGTISGVFVAFNAADARDDRDLAASRAGCARYLQDRADGILRDLSLARFALRAASAGGPNAAAYREVAREALARADAARDRMLGAPPERLTTEAVITACRRAYP